MSNDQDNGMNDALLDEVGAAFSRLRRRTTQVPVNPPVSRKDLSRNLVINLVDDAGGTLTVSRLAEQLSIDVSVASRMVSDGISNGYLMRLASQHDGRQSVIQLTPDGYALRNRFRSQQRQAFEYITRDWPASERLEFARLLLKYSQATDQLSSPDGSVSSPAITGTSD
ncbi:winged helix-turn-helix transcriptional regulator [Deinococcus sp. Arct2-2]|uniref:MarR family winged helix-turn-helix transcriptional regulator n=1 Tax=Deinococcus sp. Arct2-2 TaxID=2568653 RepID=UPI0010A2E145|nr:MarR family winged helix-turn-helix transcriptional regulator [Deinococcus sp. Arct2-2]THF68544.1 winged helix-turn-helix transcriptional regulator [Deinococcus sp. Arct2-2]